MERNRKTGRKEVIRNASGNDVFTGLFCFQSPDEDLIAKKPSGHVKTGSLLFLSMGKRREEPLDVQLRLLNFLKEEKNGVKRQWRKKTFFCPVHPRSFLFPEFETV